MSGLPADAEGRAPDTRRPSVVPALLAGEVTLVLTAAVLVPLLSWAASATYPDGSAAMVGGISLVVGAIYALIGAVVAVPLLARLTAARLAAWSADRSAGVSAAAHAGVAALVALPLPLVGLVVQSVQNRGMDLPSDLFVLGVFGAPAIVGAALAPAVHRWAAGDDARSRRLVLLGGVALVVVIAAAALLMVAF